MAWSLRSERIRGKGLDIVLCEEVSQLASNECGSKTFNSCFISAPQTSQDLMAQCNKRHKGKEILATLSRTNYCIF